MRPRSALTAVVLLLVLWGVLLAQKPFKEYPGEERVPLPPDWNVPHEWVTARLMWRSYRGGRMAFGFGGWGTDYPGGDRNLIEGVRRLTRIDVRARGRKLGDAGQRRKRQFGRREEEVSVPALEAHLGLQCHARTREAAPSPDRGRVKRGARPRTRSPEVPRMPPNARTPPAALLLPAVAAAALPTGTIPVGLGLVVNGASTYAFQILAFRQLAPDRAWLADVSRALGGAPAPVLGNTLEHKVEEPTTAASVLDERDPRARRDVLEAGDAEANERFGTGDLA